MARFFVELPVFESDGLHTDRVQEMKNMVQPNYPLIHSICASLFPDKISFLNPLVQFKGKNKLEIKNTPKFS